MICFGGNKYFKIGIDGALMGNSDVIKKLTDWSDFIIILHEILNILYMCVRIKLK